MCRNICRHIHFFSVLMREFYARLHIRCRKIFRLPQMEIHISTQANNVNYLTCLFWKKLGAKRVVTARELSLAEIAEIRANIPDDLELETFVHGAMCISYS